MSLPGADQLSWIEDAVAEYISERKEHFGPQCSALTEGERASLVYYFPLVDLNRVRVRNIEPARVPNPTFYPQLRTFGFTNLPDFAAMAAITFDDVVVSHVPFTPLLLFHELVHVVQYRLLGIETFARLYVQGFLKRGCYDAIPLEVCAYGLEDRFSADAAPFSVEHEVEDWIIAGRF